MFGTPNWFEQMPVSLSSELSDLPCFAVEHRAITPEDGTVVHQQLFSEDQLVGWIPGQATPSPDLTLIRPIDCDAGDLMGRLAATEIITGTTVIIGQDHQTCPLGITNMSRPGLDKVATRTVDFALQVLDTPFGDAELAIRLNPDGAQHLIQPSRANGDITLRLPWPALTEWFHTDTRLGYLINRGDIYVNGPIFKLSYIEGHLSWLPTPQDRQRCGSFRRIMDTYRRLRRSPAYLELMDAIEEALPP